MMRNRKIVIIDYQMSNLFSVMRALERLGCSPILGFTEKDLKDADGVILPGVGAFSSAVSNLEKLKLKEPILDYIESGKPFMGICLGLQLLFETSEEFGDHFGLGVINGDVKKFRNLTNNNDPIPQIGWNKLNFSKSILDATPFNGINQDSWMYFIHSYYVLPEDDEIILSKTSYCGFEYCSSIKYNNVFATQFHPEKSGELGLKIYDNWLKEKI